jgi:hypothetical protein
LVLLLSLAGAACAGSPTPAAHDATQGTAPRATVTEGPQTASPPANDAVVWDYEVDADAALDLAVKAKFRGPAKGELRVDDAAGPFVDRLEIADGNGWRKVAIGDAQWASACARGCSLRYRFRLRDCAKTVADLDTAILAGGAIFAPPSTWLVHPSDEPAGRYRFHVRTPAGISFETGVRVAPAAPVPGSYEGPTASIEEAAFAGFGAFRRGHVADPGINSAVAPEVALSDAVLSKWLSAEVGAISRYFARPPDGHAMLFVAPGTSALTGGKTLGAGGASIVVRLGTGITANQLMEDWVMAHELIHVAFPDLDRRYTWFSEGLATYVEPVARERAGLSTREKVWEGMLEGFPQGMPQASDGGLDGTQEWGRVYWGGALYFFLCDVRIREKTSGARGLEDGLRAVVATGGNVEAMMPLERVLDIADKATGTTVMKTTYEELGSARGNIDLAGLLKRLGLRMEKAAVRFDDKAPLASVRDAILPRTPTVVAH